MFDQESAVKIFDAKDIILLRDCVKSFQFEQNRLLAVAMLDKGELTAEQFEHYMRELSLWLLDDM